MMLAFLQSDLVRWALDVDRIPRDGADIQIAWEHPWALWVWAMLMLGAGVFALWSYRRLTGHRTGRVVLAATRALAIVLLLVLIAGPMLLMPRESVEEDWVIALVDRSASMAIADGEVAGSDAPARQSRDAQLRDVLESSAEVWDTLAAERQLVWLGFDRGAFNLLGDEDGNADDDIAASYPTVLDAPQGERTRLDTALQQALQRAAARPLSGIVVLTDGRTSDPPSRALIRQLQNDAVEVFVVPLGSPDPVGDLAIRRVDAPRRAFVNDKVPVAVEVDRLGEAVRTMGGTLKLIDTQTNETLDEVSLMPGDERDRVSLTATPDLAGETTWQVVIETPEPDLIPSNNLKPFDIELVDRPLRVLFVEGYPRWEYRYLKNLLIREQSIESSVILLSADRDFAQEGNMPITRLPRSPEEFAEYDVIVIGDVPGGFFSPDQLDMMRMHIAQRGAGLLWIGGERSTPATYAGNPLADLLPFRGALNLPVISSAINMQSTAVADRLGVLQLTSRSETGWPRELSDASYGWSQLYFAQRIEPGQLKPTAEVLAATVQDDLPLVVAMRYGAGQSIYVATDEIWRWRFGRGEYYPDQFWVQMIRTLGRQHLAQAGDQALLTVSPRRVETNQPVRISVTLLDERTIELLEAQRQTAIRAAVTTAAGEPVGEVDLERVEGTANQFAGMYLPGRAGELRVTLADSMMRDIGIDLDLSGTLDVFTPDDELRRPETDHPLLASLAEATGGEVLDVDGLDTLPQRIPNREVKTLNPLTERIWDTPLAFVLLLVLLTFEWIGRKMLRLV